MSSYFDTMASCVEDPKYLLRLITKQYAWYLRQLNKECLIKELERLAEFERRFVTEFTEEAMDRAIAGGYPSSYVQDMHTFAHDLATAQIRLRGRRRALDNPPIPY